MEALLDEFRALGEYTNNKACNQFYQKHNTTFRALLETVATPEDKQRVEDFFIAVVRIGKSDWLEKFCDPIMERRKLIDWKNRDDFVNEIFNAMIENGSKIKDTHVFYGWFAGNLLDLLVSHQLIERNHEKMMEIMTMPFDHLDQLDLPITVVATRCSLPYPWVDHPESIPIMIKCLWKLVDFNPDIPETRKIYSHASCLFHRMFCYQSGTAIHLSVLEDVTRVFNRCVEFDYFQSEEDPKSKNLANTMIHGIMNEFLSNGNKGVDLVRPMMAGIKKIWKCPDKILRMIADYIITAMAGEADLMGDTMDDVLELFFKSKQPHIAMKLEKIYEGQPDKIRPLLPKFLELATADSSDEHIKSQVLTMFAKIAITEPELATTDMISAIARTLPVTREGSRVLSQQILQAISFLKAVADHRPADVIVHQDILMKCYEHQDSAAHLISGIFEKLAVDEYHQRKYMNMFAARLDTVTASGTQLRIIMAMRSLGLKCPAILREHRSLIEKLREQNELKDWCQSTLYVMDDLTLDGVANDVTAQQKEIIHLDTRITSTEGDVTTIKADVQENKKDIAVVRSDVANQGEKLDQLKVIVDETVERVDELERKTLSHAPAWSRDVAKLLNPQTDCDWRLLSTRLGYLPEDVRNWATQPDPCLSMLDEWFATHKTREATHAIRKTLVEMNRTDASTVVDRALTAVGKSIFFKEHVISNNDEEPADPPPIFISYQWAIQREVKLLRRHLGLSGYASWMDIGQMGGGDKLFAKIDAGIRAAKVVVCCVTSKYAESPNCNREVNLAITLGKPIIPLLIEKMSWPPPGSMGPIFGEYIFVRFFQRDGEATKDDRYWPVDKFSELLLQLRYNIAPQIDAILEDSLYQNWWKPPPEVTACKPRNAVSSGLPAVEIPETISKPATAPEVFISYQWDKQPQIKELYRRLTELGFSCWLDVLQMGGGDSLFDKIDGGVRGCKVVISCVTSKYSMSPNCRREVSLANVLKRAIIPLRLEVITWPPEGPMSLVFTQMQYIDFTKPSTDVQNKWNCSQFNELVKKLIIHVPKDIKPSVNNLRVQNYGGNGQGKPVVQTTRYY